MGIVGKIFVSALEKAALLTLLRFNTIKSILINSKKSNITNWTIPPGTIVLRPLEKMRVNLNLFEVQVVDQISLTCQFLQVIFQLFWSSFLQHLSKQSYGQNFLWIMNMCKINRDNHCGHFLNVCSNYWNQTFWYVDCKEVELYENNFFYSVILGSHSE